MSQLDENLTRLAQFKDLQAHHTDFRFEKYINYTENIRGKKEA